MYFGLHLSYSNIDIELSEFESLPQRVAIGALESVDLTRKSFKGLDKARMYVS